MTCPSRTHLGDEFRISRQKIVLEFILKAPERLCGASHRLQKGDRDFDCLRHCDLETDNITALAMENHVIALPAR